MRRLRLRERTVGLGFNRVDEVRKLDGVLNEEDGDVVADEVPVAFLGVELHCKATNVAREVERSLASRDGREADEGFCLLANALEDVGARNVGQRFRQLEKAVRTVAAGMHDPLRDALMIEVEDLLAEVEVLDESRATSALPQGVLIVCNWDALLRSERRDLGVIGCLMSFAAGATI